MGATTRGGTRVARRRNGGRLRGSAVILTLAALVAACGDTPPTPTPSASSSPGTTPTPAASASPGPDATTSPDPAASPGVAWAPVVLADATPVATLEPTSAGLGGVATTTAFRLTSLDGTPPADLAARLTVEPSVTLAVASTEGATALLRPATALRPSTTYRVALRRADGSIEASWAAQTAGPLHLVESIPGDAATRVPRDAGIELIFDQAGVATSDLEAHLRIEPAITGRLQAAGRSLVFIPARPLARGTLYTVTITRGLPVAGTDQRLADDVTFRFETVSRGTSRTTVGLRRTFVEATPRERAAMSIWWEGPENAHAPGQVPVSVHRLDGMAAAEAAWRAISHAPTWTQADTRRAVPTGALPQVVDVRVPVRGGDEGLWFRLPEPLPRGWYVVTMSWAGIPRQAVLQVTDLATYAMVTTTRSAVWVNDLASGRPVVGAGVAIRGTRLGATDAEGLAVGRTPAAATSDQGNTDGPPLVEVRAGARTAFQPIATDDQLCAYCASDGNDDVWRVLTSDRFRYRSTDTVNAWGVVRNRDSGAVPSSLRVALRTTDGDDSASPISVTTVTPDAVGAFAVAVSLVALPAGQYRLTVDAGGTAVGELWFDVGTITKPAYRLTIGTDHRAITAGDPVAVDVHGSFFEGTPVAGTRVLLEPEEGRGDSVTTDADGDATGHVRPGLSGDDQWTIVSIQASPELPEEADLATWTSVAVFRGSNVVDVAGTLAGQRLRIDGAVSWVDFDRFDAADANDLWAVDPRGTPHAGAEVQLRIEEHWTVRRKIGSRYDFILKRVVPEYDYSDRSRIVGSRHVIAGPDGRFHTALAVDGGGRSYEITAVFVDSGRTLRTSAWADDVERNEETGGVYLAEPGSGDEERTYGVGDPIRLRFTGGMAAPRVERYLFAVTQRGLRSVDVQASPDFRATFSADDVPGLDVFGVRFTRFGYEETWGYGARFRVTDRRLDVRVTADRAGYAPGETATLTIRTLDPSGHPVAASVFVQAVDEKLFATGDAALTDPIDMLYAGVGNGILATVRSHQSPGDDLYGEGGDTTGGGGDDGVRGDFRDWLIGRLVRTDATGRATLEMPLSDDLTSWHVTAEGVDRSLRAGAGELLVPVRVPFFAEVTMPATFVAADRPIVRVRAFGGDLKAGDPVSITVRSDSLGLAPVTVAGTAFEAVEVPLGKLLVGKHAVRVEASAHGGRLNDALDRSVEVLASRAAQDVTTWQPLAGTIPVAAGGGFTRLVLVDAGRGRVVPLLGDLAASGGSRCDQVVAAGLASRVLQDAFGITTAPVDDLALRQFVGEDEEGMSIVPWGSTNLEVTALTAMSGDPRIDASTLHLPLWVAANGSDTVRSRRLLALAGLAALGDPVLQDVRAAAAEPDLTVEERVNLSLAALFAGDEALARSIEHQLLREHGQHLGPWTKLVGSSREQSSVLTPRLAIVAASLGEPVAAEMDAWAAENPPTQTTVVLERALAARGWAERVPGAAAKAAVTIDGTRSELDVLPETAASLTLTPAQAAGATIEPVSGQVLVVTTHSVPLDPSSLTVPRGQKLTRTVAPGMRIGETDTVVVTLRVTLGGDARDECWSLVDIVPSGLAPIGGGRLDEEGYSYDPAWVDGQRVSFCVSRDPRNPVQEIRYVARVVDPGSYAWEPAVLQSSIVPEQGIATDPGTLVIRGAGG